MNVNIKIEKMILGLKGSKNDLKGKQPAYISSELVKLVIGGR